MKYSNLRNIQRRQRGFTLVELMITVAVVGILTAIAYPSYATYLRRGRIGDAVSALSQYQIQMEQASQDNGNYGATACALGAPGPSPYFSFACALGSNGLSFVATATGTGMLDGYAYTIDNTGAKTTTAFPSGLALPAQCWATKAGDC